ncbi:MAG: alpha/beta fold hydrolase [Actinomycetota bacterium]
MPEVLAPDGIGLHVDVDGHGDPVTVFAHGLTNSCMELAAFTPFAPGTKVRFCFRGHGHSQVAPAGSYGFGDYAGDLDAVAGAYGATRAVGTSLGAGAMTRSLAEAPDRFERLVFLLPAALDQPVAGHPLSLRTAELLETLPKDEAIAAALAESGREAAYARAPGLREFDLLLWQDLDPVGVARAIRGVIGQRAIEDRALLRKVSAPALIIARRGDALHPVEVGRSIAELLPNAELIELGSEQELFDAIPMLVERVARFLA